MSTSIIILTILYFFVCQYLIQKKADKLFFMILLNKISIPKNFLFAIFIIALSILPNIISPIFIFVPIMTTIFFGSYLTERLTHRIEEKS